MGCYKNYPYMGVDVNFLLFYVAWESRQTAHYLFLKIMMKGSMVFNSDHLENSLMTNENPWKNKIYGLQAQWGKVSMVRQSESDDIFVCGVKAKELMITGTLILVFLFD